jgi:hypothetical protein
MRRILVVSCLLYVGISFIVGIHGIIVGTRGAKDDDDAISFEVIDHAIRWPLWLFE